MSDFNTFKNEFTLIVNNLAKAVIAEADKVSLNPQNPETEENLRVLVEQLCVEAVDKILKMVELAAGKLKETPSDRKDLPRDRKDPPESDESRECLTKTTEGGGERPPTEQTYILVCRSAAVNSKCLLLSPQSDANGGNKTVSMDESGDSERSAASSPPPQADVPDHEYARPSSRPPGAASSLRGGASAARSRKRRRRDEDTTDGYRQCSRCEKLFPNAERLSDHERKSHPVCSVCGAAFTGHLSLREHVTTEHGLLPYGCSFCPKRFNHNAHRNLHVKTRHTGEKSCRCDLCGKAYSSVSLMKTHRLTHAEKTFICDVCGKRFFHAGHLTRHKAAHQELRPHRCDVCGKGFTQAANLLRHQLVHGDVRPYRCTLCGKGFTQAANLCTHQASHNGERQLCSICGKSFRFLKNHVICKHSQDLPAGELPDGDAIITCELCGKKFPHLSQFRVHQRSHTGEKPFGCAACGKTYAMKQQLRDHMYTHSGEKPFRCSLCGKSFHLRASFSRHRSIHSGETPFGCSLCGKHFRLQSFLKAHLQTKAHLKQTQSATAHL